MSAESVLIYYGVKSPVSEKEVEELERGEHSAQMTARKFRLDCDWGYSTVLMNEYYLFIGKKLGTMGCEHHWNQEISGVDLARIIVEAKAALKQTGFNAEPKLLMHFRPDL